MAGFNVLSRNELSALLKEKIRAKGGVIENIGTVEGSSWPLRRTEGIRIRNSRLSCIGVWGNLFARKQLANCRFENVELDGFKCYKAHLINCKFDNCRFSHCWSSCFVNCIIQDCEFSNCVVNYVDFLGCKIKDLTWDCKGTDAVFERCSLSDCVFKGCLRGAAFRFNKYENVSFRELDLIDGTFRDGFDVDAEYPQLNNSFVMRKDALSRSKELLREMLSAESYRKFDEYVSFWEREDMVHCVDPERFKDIEKGDRALIMNTLFELRYVGTRDANI